MEKYKPGFELIRNEGAVFVNSYQSVDFTDSIATGFSTIKLPVNKVILNTAVPKHWRIKFDAKKMEVDSVVHLLSNADTLNAVVAALNSNEFINEFFETATNAKSGLFYTNTALLTYDLIINKVQTSLAKYGLVSEGAVGLVLAALLVDTLNELGIIAYSGSTIAIVTRTRLFADREDLLMELRKARISFIISKLDRSRIKTTSKMGVGVLAQAVAASFGEVAIELSRLQMVEQDLENIFALVRAYVTKDFSLYARDELGIFEESEFLEFASNFTIVTLALTHEGKTRPFAGAFYWSQILARVNVALRSSNTIQITELSAVKEYFTMTSISDQLGLKRGIVLTKNYKDETPFEPYFNTYTGLGYSRIVKDTAAEMAMTGLVGQLKRIDSATLHDYYSKMFSLITTSSVPHFVYSSFMKPEDVAHFAAACSGSIEIGSYRLTEDLYYRTLVFEVPTRGSRVYEEASAFGVAKFTNPFAALFFAEDEFKGKKILSYSEPVIGETDRVSYAGLQEISTDKIGKEIVMDLVVGGTKARTRWQLDKLLGTPGLAHTMMIRPVVGETVVTRLVESYTEIAKLAQDTFGMGKDFQLTLALQFSKIIEPMFLSQDVAQITTSAMSQLWHTLASDTRDMKKSGFSKSSFYDLRFKAEMKFRSALFFAYVTGFITDGKIIKEIVDAWNDAGGFNHI